jgi:pSer/pThr/pTyr-binding forkhead associated (FHA) protein
MIELLYEQDDGETRIFPIEALPAVIGRVKGVAVILPDRSVSREHARLFLRDDTLHLADMNSSNGTFVNGQKITLSPLRPGDEIRLGKVVLRLAPTKAAQAGPPKEEESIPVEAESPPDLHDEIILPDAEPFMEKEAVDPQETKRSPAPPPTRTVTPSPGAAAQAGSGIQFKEQILQYSRIDARRGRSFLKDDFSQYGGLPRLIAVAALIALALGSFFFFKWLGSEVTPDTMGVDDGVQSVEEE